MSKAIQGAAMLAGWAGLEVADFAFTGGAGFAISEFLLGNFGNSLLLGGLSLEAGAIASALTSNRGMGITTRQPAAYRQIIYGGDVRVAGIKVYESTTGSSHDQWNCVIVLSGHVVDSITDVWLDGRKVYFQGSGAGWSVRNGQGFGGIANGNTYTGPDGNQYNFGGTEHSGLYMEARYGDQLPGDVMSALTANDPAWAADGHGNSPWLAGCAYVYIKLEYNPTVFPNGPGATEIRFGVKGKNNIWDPRTGATGWTCNPALCIADVIRDTQFGLGDVEAFQDSGSLAQLIAAANVCDESVLVQALSATTPTYEQRYCTHHRYDCGTPPGNAIDEMLKSCGGRVSMPGGEWYLYPAYWQGPSFTFDANVLSGPISWEPYRSQKDLCNRKSGTYTAPGFPWNIEGNLYNKNGFYDGGIQNNFNFADQPTDYPPYASDPLHGYATDQYLNEDSGLKGAWDGVTSWNLGDVVTRSGVLYKSLIAANVNFDPATHSFPNAAASAWVSYTPYTAGESVAFGGRFYVALASTTGNQPDTSPGDWALCAWVPYQNLLPSQLMLPAVQSVTQAQRLAKIEYLRNRYQGSGDFPMMQRAFAMQCCDVMEFTFTAMGWTEKVLEIVGAKSSLGEMETGSNGESVPVEEFSVSVAETDPSIYAWNPATEELTIYDVPAQPQQVNSIVAPPTGMSLTSGAVTAIVAPDGTVRPRIEVEWTAPADTRVTLVQVQYQLAPGGVATGPWIDAVTVDVALSVAYVPDVVSGQEYNVRIRSLRSVNGASSVWVEQDNYTVVLTLSVIAQGLNALDPGSLIGEAFAPVAFTGNTTSGSAAIAGVSSTAGLLVGQGVTGAGIPAGAVIASIGSGTITLSANATATASAVALTGAGTAAIVPADGVGAFTAQIGSLSVAVAPANYPLLEILQQQLYYVYYIDPTLAGGAVTAIGTTNQADFINKVGYFLIDQVVTPKWVSGTGGTGGIYRPSAYSDTGTRSTQGPASAYDGNTSTFAKVSGNMNGSGGGSVSSSNGVCTWSGFPPVTLPASTLYIVAQTVANTDASIDYDLSCTIAGVATDILAGAASTGQTVYTVAVAAGVDLSTISVGAMVKGSDCSYYDSLTAFNQTASMSIFEIYIQ